MMPLFSTSRKLFDFAQHFGGRWNDAASASKEGYAACAVCSKTDILDHLTHAHLNREHSLNALCRVGNGFFWERPERNRADETNLDAFCARAFDRASDNAGSGTVCGDDVFRVFCEIFLNTNLVCLDLLLALKALNDGALQFVRL